MDESIDLNSEATTQTCSPAVDFQRLDARVINLWQVSNLIGFGVVLLLVGISLGVALAVIPDAVIWLAIAFAALLPLAYWFCLVRPKRLYQSWGYRLDEKILETESGLLIRVSRLLPLNRVQHVDIERGPLARLYGLATLILYTAGTHAASLSIPGLDEKVATELRDRLIEIGGDDAV